MFLRQVAHGPQRRDLALEHQIADRDAAGVHPHDHRRQRPLGHPRHRPVRHRHHLGHRLAHVGAREERQLGQGDLLDIPRVDILNAVHVLEIQLELIDDEAFHLVGAHADIIEEDVDLRHVQRGEDVHPHPAVGQRATADQGHDQHQDRDRMSHREAGRIHDLLPQPSQEFHAQRKAERVADGATRYDPKSSPPMPYARKSRGRAGPSRLLRSGDASALW